MSDNQRRVYCRILFLAICAFPTAFVGYWICHPQTARGWEKTLQAQLGVTTSIDSIETPGPYVTILRGLEFTDPELGTLFKAVEAKIEFGQDKNVISIPYRVQGLNNKGVACLIKKVNENLIRAHRVDKPWRIQFDKNTVISQDLAVDVADLRAGEFLPQFPMSELNLDITPLADGTRADLRFKVPMSNAPDNVVQCALVRSEEHGHKMGFTSNTVALPCWLVSDVIPIVSSSFGTEAKFVGLVEVEPTPGKREVNINGTFHQVDLDRSFPIPSGDQRFGQIELQNLRFVNSVVKSGDGWIHQGSEPSMRINPIELYSLTRQIAPTQAIRSALELRNRVVDQKIYR